MYKRLLEFFSIYNTKRRSLMKMYYQGAVEIDGFDYKENQAKFLI